MNTLRCAMAVTLTVGALLAGRGAMHSEQAAAGSDLITSVPVAGDVESELNAFSVAAGPVPYSGSAGSSELGGSLGETDRSQRGGEPAESAESGPRCPYIYCIFVG